MRRSPRSIFLVLSGSIALILLSVGTVMAENPPKPTDPPQATVAKAPMPAWTQERAPDENPSAEERASMLGKAAVAGSPTSFRYYHVSGSVLDPRDSAGTTKDYSAAGCTYVVAGTDRILNANLHLPHGAIIKFLRIYYNDTNAANEVRGYITRYDDGSATSDLTTAASTGSAGVGTALSPEITEVVDTVNYSYVVIGWPDALGTTNQICGIRVAYYDAAEGHFNSVPPCRVFDTRAVGSQTTGAPLPNPGPHNFRIQGNCGIPNGATAAVLNATVVAPTQAGDLRLFPAGGPQPVVSTLNYPAGVGALANGAVLPLATVAAPADKDMSVLLGMVAAGTVHLIIDVTGYYY